MDVGTKRIGVAYSDPLGISTNPLPYIDNDENAFEKIKDIVKEYNVGTVVIGLPLTLKGKEGTQAKLTKEFAQKLKSYLPENVGIEFIDERFTTSLAEKQLKETGKKSKKKDKVDSLSAVFILKTYLEKKQYMNG
ncbi:Holliday junction resolvase RuvX [Persephonella sp.]